MDNKNLINLLKSTATLLELHNAHPRKVTYYRHAASLVAQLTQDVTLLSQEALSRIQGIHPTIVTLIHEINTTGTLAYWEELMAKTPPGILDMLTLRGLGPKKVRAIWQDLGIVLIADLQRACETGRIAQLPGFGPKTQQAIQASILWRQKHQGMFLYAQALPYATELETHLKQAFPNLLIALAGDLRRKLETVTHVVILIGTHNPTAVVSWLAQVTTIQKEAKCAGPFAWRGKFIANDLQLVILFCTPNVFYQQLFLQTGTERHLAMPVQQGKSLGEVFATCTDLGSEAAGYQQAQLPYIPPELREEVMVVDLTRKQSIPPLLEMEDLQGVLHCHTTYSDGRHSLEEMAHYCKELGYTYLGIADHSYAAHYAGGLTIHALQQQHKEIDRLNSVLAPFKILKGIEVDILLDGTLDYPADVLATFDFVIASIHTGLQMDSQQATNRLIKAISNPFTTILGHLTGRLLLQRPGYPIDHQAVIQACATHGVSIELNANPQRLDLDWRWIPEAIRQNVWLSINPDAHAKEQIQYIYYGVCVGRKGGLTKQHTLNALSQATVTQYFQHRKAKRNLSP